MKKCIGVLLFLIVSFFGFAQTGPGGVGANDGTSSLKVWYRTDFGVSVTGTSIDAITNGAGISALDISETLTQRPTLVSAAVNGYDEISFSGSNRLRTGLTLTTSNFVNDQASSFVVCRADNTTQTSSVYLTDPLVGSTRFSNHIPWSGTVYYDIGLCCGTSGRVSQGGLSGLTNYSVWSYDAIASTGKQIFRNGSQIASTAGSSTYNSHATQRFNIGANTSGSNGFQGDITEVIVFNAKVNNAQRIIVENYLAAKYGITTASNNVYNEDDVANGNFDHDVAGIGRVDASNIHNDAQGTGVIRVLNPTDLGNNEFFMWGHDNGELRATETSDVPTGLGVVARFQRVWRASEVNTSGTSVDVGGIDIRFDLTGLGSVTASDLRLLVDANNNSNFADETPISGATSLGSNIYQFAGITAISDNLRFTLGTIDIAQTPLPIELLSFNVTILENGEKVKLDWQTATETNNDFFTIERSSDGTNWEIVKEIEGAGNSSIVLKYSEIDYNPYSERSYYRLKQTDFDGQYTYSQIKSITLHRMNSLSIYPNPTKNLVTIKSTKSELQNIEIFNSLGQNITSKVKQNYPNESTIILDLSNLEVGEYLLKTKTKTNKLYKQ